MTGEAALNVLLFLQETYYGLQPVRLTRGVTALVFNFIQRGCDNTCPYTRGRERSRSLRDILAEVQALVSKG